MRSERGPDPGGTVGSVAVRDDDGRERGQGLTRVGLGVTTALVVVLLDQLTKIWAVADLADGPIEVIGEFFELRLTRNPGAAFSSFQGGGPILGLVAVVMAIVIIFALSSTERRSEALALGAVMGGALGNFVDRVFRGEGFLDGAVIDFIDFSFWPTFNVADSGITLGVIALLILSFFTGASDESA